MARAAAATAAVDAFLVVVLNAVEAVLHAPFAAGSAAVHTMLVVVLNAVGAVLKGKKAPPDCGGGERYTFRGLSFLSRLGGVDRRAN
jgi:hypothetical protein